MTEDVLRHSDGSMFLRGNKEQAAREPDRMYEDGDEEIKKRDGKKWN